MSVYRGNGQHFDALNLEQKQDTVKWMIAAYVPGIETLGFPKLAVISLLVRLLAPSRLHIIVLWTMGGICCMSLTAMVMTLTLQCTPPRALWTFSLPHNCLHPSVLEGLAFWASGEFTFHLTTNKNGKQWLNTAPTPSMLGVPRLLPGNVSSYRALEASDANAEEAGSQLCPWDGHCVSVCPATSLQRALATNGEPDPDVSA